MQVTNVQVSANESCLPKKKKKITENFLEMAAVLEGYVFEIASPGCCL